MFASYDDLLWSDRIDAVYLPLPNSMHEQWAIRAAERGKHVFCEKPLATSAAAAQRMVDAAAGSGVLLMEAMVFRYHPQTLRLRRLLDAGAIGDLRHVDVRMGAPLGPGNIRWQPELGGGALMDIGCYVITVARWAAGAEPTRVTAVWQEDRAGGVDRHLGLLLEFPDGVVATLFGAFDTASMRGAHLAGSGGTLHIEQPTHPYEDSAYTLTTPQATERVTLHNGVRSFTPAVDHFHDCLLDGAAPRAGQHRRHRHPARHGRRRRVGTHRRHRTTGLEQLELAFVAAHLAEVAAGDGEHRLCHRADLTLDVVLMIDPVLPLGGRLRAFDRNHVVDHAAPG